MSNITPAMIQNQIAKGTFRPHTALTNLGMAYFQNASNYFAKAIFPICPVQLSSDTYYIFNKEDLLKDNWGPKPAYGKVNPAAVSESTGTYSCQVDQMIMGIDQIRQNDQQRRPGPALKDPRIQRTKTMAEQANIHQDKIFAQKFFKSGVWKDEWTGVDETSVSGNQFIKFTNGNSDPIKFIRDQKLRMFQQTGRMPNRLAMGANVFNALQNHEGILERVKYGGTTANPADVDKNVLAQLFGIDEIAVFMSIHNQAMMGKDADMQFIADPNALLLVYATDAPATDEPSAGYIFTWDMLGDGQTMPIFHYMGENGTHSEYVEGLMAYDMRKTADDLAMFCKDVV